MTTFLSNLRPGWLASYRDTPEAAWEKAEVIANNPQDGCLILAVGNQRNLVTLDLNQPEHRAKLGAPF